MVYVRDMLDLVAELYAIAASDKQKQEITAGELQELDAIQSSLALMWINLHRFFQPQFIGNNIVGIKEPEIDGTVTFTANQLGFLLNQLKEIGAEKVHLVQVNGNTEIIAHTISEIPTFKIFYKEK